MAVRTIGTEIVLSGEKQFNDAMKGINNNLKNMKSDMALATAEFADNANSVEALTAKQKLLQSSVDQHRAKVGALREMYEQQKKKYGENSAAADKYKQQLNQATAALLKEESALKKTADALDDAESEANHYVPVTEKLANALKKPGEKFEDLKKKINESAKELPVISELMDVATVSAKGLGKAAGVAATGVKASLKSMGTAAGGIAKGVGIVSAASAAGVAAIGAGGVAALVAMTNMAKESAEAAKAAKEAGEELTFSQEKWLKYADQLDALDASVANAKGALAGILLPVLGELSTTGAAFLDSFTRDMRAAGNNTERQTQVLSNHIKKGVLLIKEELPQYISLGKDLIGGLAEGLSEAGPDVLDMGLDLMMNLLDLMFDFAPELANMAILLVQKLVTGLADQGPEVMESAIGMVEQIVLGLAQAAPELIPAAGKLILTFLMALLSAAPDLLAAGLELVKAILTGIFSGDMDGTGKELIDTLIKSIEESIKVFLDLGSEIVQLLGEGLSEAWAGFVEWFNSLWDKDLGRRTIDVDVRSKGGGSFGNDVDGNHATGLNYVPFDGYLARLHRGEAVLTEAEATAYRTGKNGGNSKTVNMTINTQSLSKEELDSIVEYINRKLVDDP